MQEEQDHNAVCRAELSGRAYKIIQRKMVSAPKWRLHYFEFNDKTKPHTKALLRN